MASDAAVLRGKEIVVTRAEPQARDLLDAIEQKGGTPIALPLLEIIDAEDGGASLAAAVERLEPSDWLVVLSPNGARRIVERCSMDEPSRRPKLAVIAGGTGAVFDDAGWSADLVPEVASSVGLLEAFAKTPIEGRVLIAQAENGRTELFVGLGERGIDVDVVTAYRNVMPSLGPEAETALLADVVVFASPSAVERYVEHVGATPTAAVCIGAVTTEAAVAAGFSTTTCDAPTVSAIVAALGVG